MAVRDRERVRVGPFTAFVDRERELKYFSFALPDPGAPSDELRAALPELNQAFAERRRTARVEHVEELTPAMREVLTEAGWTLSERMPVMTCAAADLTSPPVPAGIEVRQLVPGCEDTLLQAYLLTQKTGFEDPHGVTEADRDKLRASLGDAFVFAACHQAEVVGTVWGAPLALGVSEVAGVATLPAFRRRGIAGLLTAAAGRAAFAAGAELCWLTAEGDDSARIYGRAGFRPAGTMWAYDSTGSARGAMP